MDGGGIQVHAAKDVLASLNLDIPVMWIQKDNHHKASKKFFDEQLYNVERNSPIFLLLADISQRVHDFAISFFRSNKAKGIFTSILDPIPGLGPKRKETLLKYFINIEAIKEADIDELKKSGMPNDIAKEIYNYFHKVD